MCIAVLTMCIIQALKYAATVKYLNEATAITVVIPLPTITILKYVVMEPLFLEVVALNVVVVQHYTTHIHTCVAEED